MTAQEREGRTEASDAQVARVDGVLVVAVVLLVLLPLGRPEEARRVLAHCNDVVIST